MAAGLNLRAQPAIVSDASRRQPAESAGLKPATSSSGWTTAPWNSPGFELVFYRRVKGDHFHQGSSAMERELPKSSRSRSPNRKARLRMRLDSQTGKSPIPRLESCALRSMPDGEIASRFAAPDGLIVAAKSPRTGHHIDLQTGDDSHHEQPAGGIAGNIPHRDRWTEDGRAVALQGSVAERSARRV